MNIINAHGCQWSSAADGARARQHQLWLAKMVFRLHFDYHGDNHPVKRLTGLHAYSLSRRAPFTGRG
ncbi:MAG: hypothetical protein CEN88_34 [Candidatus Berkelbacteria bacterium Licking1014_2]|uniref:Uncharacterized protein n=1 Tax=Candidatus Berkelbacteria bacterium Licking1014_2 TaxID=2017146 RepID=A0A554LX26_9BACT|nr:MAG: hypothetical protein CEN88_34 [Candidatus Berkelbacteria bacterium Licking1014_2]